MRVPDPDNVGELRHLLDMAFDPGTSAWTLNAHGEWTRNTGETDMQAALVERQRRHRASP